jgi:hypothetical protein
MLSGYICTYLKYLCVTIVFVASIFFFSELASRATHDGIRERGGEGSREHKEGDMKGGWCQQVEKEGGADDRTDVACLHSKSSTIYLLYSTPRP